MRDVFRDSDDDGEDRVRNIFFLLTFFLYVSFGCLNFCILKLIGDCFFEE